MRLINKLLASMLLVSSIIYAGDINLDSIGANIGCTKMDVKQIDEIGSITLAKDPDDKMRQIELYALLGGVFEDSSIKPTLNFIHSWNNDLSTNSVLIGVNKYYMFDKYNLYAGILGGVGRLKWNYNPINNTKETDYGASSLVGVIQLGVEYPLNDKIFLNVNTKYMLHNYSTELQPVNSVHSELIHNHSCLLSVGLRIVLGE